MNNYPPKWRWPALDISPQATDEVNSRFNIYKNRTILTCLFLQRVQLFRAQILRK